jgi:hypothetical protein
MTTAAGKVRGGVIVLDGAAPAEGTLVTVVFDDDAVYQLNADEVAALETAEEDMDAGHAVSAQQVMAELRQRG